MVVIGALVSVTILLIFWRAIASGSQLAWVKRIRPTVAVAERIGRPRVLLPGDPAAAGAVAMVVPEAAAPVAAKLTGEQVTTPRALPTAEPAWAEHGSVTADDRAWPRARQPSTTPSGLQGQAGVMPAKGGRVDLSDDEIIAAVKFMSGS
jgi:cytochrome c5